MASLLSPALQKCSTSAGPCLHPPFQNTQTYTLSLKKAAKSGKAIIITPDFIFPNTELVASHRSSVSTATRSFKARGHIYQWPVVIPDAACVACSKFPESRTYTGVSWPDAIIATNEIVVKHRINRWSMAAFVKMHASALSVGFLDRLSKTSHNNMRTIWMGRSDWQGCLHGVCVSLTEQIALLISAIRPYTVVHLPVWHISTAYDGQNHNGY